MHRPPSHRKGDERRRYAREMTPYYTLGVKKTHRSRGVQFRLNPHSRPYKYISSNDEEEASGGNTGRPDIYHTYDRTHHLNRRYESCEHTQKTKNSMVRFFPICQSQFGLSEAKALLVLPLKPEPVTSIP